MTIRENIEHIRERMEAACLRAGRPATVKPITEPAENATRRPRFRLLRQALPSWGKIMPRKSGKS